MVEHCGEIARVCSGLPETTRDYPQQVVEHIDTGSRGTWRARALLFVALLIGDRAGPFAAASHAAGQDADEEIAPRRRAALWLMGDCRRRATHGGAFRTGRHG